MKNRRVAVLRGGPSDEYDVSMKTGASVLEVLRRKGVPTLDVIVNRRGDWLLNGFHKLPAEALVAVDVVFIALHGSYGEDGTVQRLLDQAGVPYTGSRAYPSAVAMNKILAKDVLRDSGIKLPAHLRVTSSGTDLRRVTSTIGSLFGPEYIVKPVNGGSSIETYYAASEHELLKALQTILRNKEEALVEEYIRGKEATVGIVEGLRGETHYVLPAIEIVPPTQSHFFDHQVKYDGTTEEICPGRFSRGEKDQLTHSALQVHDLLNLSHYSRSDFIVSPNGVYFLEANTLPGLTEESLLPKALASVGHTLDDLVLHLLETAIHS